VPPPGGRDIYKAPSRDLHKFVGIASLKRVYTPRCVDRECRYIKLRDNRVATKAFVQAEVETSGEIYSALLLCLYRIHLYVSVFIFPVIIIRGRVQCSLRLLAKSACLSISVIPKRKHRSPLLNGSLSS
jgi:hypothetical protein